jgi:opacity protein-like surface antigen
VHRAWLRATLLAGTVAVGMTAGAAGAAAAGAPPGADDEDDSAALSLPGPAGAPAPPRALTLLTEAAAGQSEQRTGPAIDAQRLSFDLHADERWSGTWRMVVDDRLDLDRVDQPPDTQAVNTLKQAYVSAQWQPDLLFDAGRINARQGVGFGYNPTDLFRADALRTVESLDPNSLRDNRLGSVMVRAERLWDGGAVTASYSPRLATAPSMAPFAADWGATNSQDRWQLALTQRLGASVSPQWLLSGTAGAPPQFGMNVTWAVGGATVGYLEASGGRSQSSWAQALDLPDSQAFRARLAAGATYNTTDKLSITVEYDYDGAARGRGAWAAARAGDPRRYGLYRTFVAAQQDLATLHGAFVYASWQDVIVRHLDLSGFLRVDLIDHSRLPWFEMRYHFTRVDAAFRWQDAVGGPTTDYGAAAARRTWQLVLDYYL